jgi:hypothetical protein
MNTMASDFVADMGARYIKWMHQSNLVWMKYGEGDTDDTQLMVGEGYEIAFSGQTKYTFLGMPAEQIQYREGAFVGFDYATESTSLEVFSVNDATGDVQLIWDQADFMGPGQYYHLYRSTTRDGFDDGSASLLVNLTWGTQFYMDGGAAQPGTQYYYMVYPVNENGVKGVSTYSLGVFTTDILPGYDTIGIPFLLEFIETLDWYCSKIDNSVGINYFLESSQRWNWHSTAMPAGAFDPQMLNAMGYQVSTTAGSKLTFVSRNF